MKIPDKLPTPPKYEGSLCKKMTEEDWIEYFKCREKYDKPMTEEEKNKIWAELEKLSELGEDENEKVFALINKIPMKPYYAFCLKSVGGLKALKDYNLYEAKKAYPDEF